MLQPRVSYGLSATPTSIAIADLNGDGAMDLVVGTAVTESQTTSSQIYVLRGNGKGTFESPVTFAAESSPTSVAIGDVNGDGLADVVVANAGANTVGVLAFDPCGSTPGTPAPTACVTGTPCGAAVTLTCAGPSGADDCIQLCDCSTDGIYCSLGRP